MGNTDSSQSVTSMHEETYKAVGQITFEELSSQAAKDTVSWPQRPSSPFPVYIAHRNYGSAIAIAMGIRASALTGNQPIKHWLCLKVRPFSRAKLDQRFIAVPEYILVQGSKVHIVRPLAAQIRHVQKRVVRSRSTRLAKTIYYLDIARVEPQTGRVTGIELTKDQFLDKVDQDSTGKGGWRQAKAVLDQDWPRQTQVLFDVSYQLAEQAGDDDGYGDDDSGDFFESSVPPIASKISSEGATAAAAAAAAAPFGEQEDDGELFDSAPTTSEFSSGGAAAAAAAAPLGAQFLDDPYSLEGSEDIERRQLEHLFSNADEWYSELCPLPFSNVHVSGLGDVEVTPSTEQLNHSHIMISTKLKSNDVLYRKMQERTT